MYYSLFKPIKDDSLMRISNDVLYFNFEIYNQLNDVKYNRLLEMMDIDDDTLYNPIIVYMLLVSADKKKLKGTIECIDYNDKLIKTIDMYKHVNTLKYRLKHDKNYLRNSISNILNEFNKIYKEIESTYWAIILNYFFQPFFDKDDNVSISNIKLHITEDKLRNILDPLYIYVCSTSIDHDIFLNRNNLEIHQKICDILTNHINNIIESIISTCEHDLSDSVVELHMKDLCRIVYNSNEYDFIDIVIGDSKILIECTINNQPKLLLPLIIHYNQYIKVIDSTSPLTIEELMIMNENQFDMDELIDDNNNSIEKYSNYTNDYYSYLLWHNNNYNDIGRNELYNLYINSKYFIFELHLIECISCQTIHSFFSDLYPNNSPRKYPIAENLSNFYFAKIESIYPLLDNGSFFNEEGVFKFVINYTVYSTSKYNKVNSFSLIIDSNHNTECIMEKSIKDTDNDIIDNIINDIKYALISHFSDINTYINDIDTNMREYINSNYKIYYNGNIEDFMTEYKYYYNKIESIFYRFKLFDIDNVIEFKIYDSLLKNIKVIDLY